MCILLQQRGARKNTTKNSKDMIEKEERKNKRNDIQNKPP